MHSLAALRKTPGTILVIGNHTPNIQAVLDFDYLSGKAEPTVTAIISASGRFQKLFWGNTEVLIPCYASLADAKTRLPTVDWMFNMDSGRRAYQTTVQFFETYPNAHGGHIFAEDVPELFALELDKRYSDKFLIGPAGVGFLIPGSLKLGAIGGIDWRQLQKNHLTTPGNVAVLSASGGMINEIITIVSQTGHRLSFALCFGGDRFPTTRPRDAFLLAEKDPATTHIVYYGELGGYDEYELAELINKNIITKPVICYIAGTIGENFDQPIQFGHAKALAGSKSETASAKRQALKVAGAIVAVSMTDFVAHIQDMQTSTDEDALTMNFEHRSASLFSSTISGESGAGYEFVGKPLQTWATTSTIAEQTITGLLGRSPKSSLTTEFFEKIFLLSVDHGPQVSGAVNTIVTARAGKGLIDSLAAGLLTIGPRFGGAVSSAAREWFDGVSEERIPATYVEQQAKKKQYIGGIGHKKYRLGIPDPRVSLLSSYAKKLSSHPHYDYARAIEAITSSKKNSLILNVDGVIAALMLDILELHEGYSRDELDALITADFFNALFVIPRTVGFISHYLDQKRLDEGLFRLPDGDVFLLNR